VRLLYRRPLGLQVRFAGTRLSDMCRGVEISDLGQLRPEFAGSWILRVGERLRLLERLMIAMEAQAVAKTTLGLDIANHEAIRPEPLFASREACVATRRWTRARGLLLLPVLQTLSHSRLRGRSVLRSGTGRCFRVASAPNCLFSGIFGRRPLQIHVRVVTLAPA
jgi:hypothetical protein